MLPAILLRAAAFCILMMAATTLAALPQDYNGFDVSNATIDTDDILSGGPPRDGIPSVDDPKFLTPGEVHNLRDDDIVVGFEHDGDARAYPLRILVWHEIVNDKIGQLAVAVTYCPLCGTAMVFDRTIGGTIRSFGVSGLLYQSDVLMYDRETESLWSQLGIKSVSGPSVGTKLDWLPSEHLSWKAWREKYPDGKVLSPDTGHRRNYDGEAYAAYFSSKTTMFPVPRHRRDLDEKDWVVGTIVDGHAKAYPLEELGAARLLHDQIGSTVITVSYDPQTRHPAVTGPDGDPIPSVMVFWFAWQAFYPDTELWKP